MSARRWLSLLIAACLLHLALILPATPEAIPLRLAPELPVGDAPQLVVHGGIEPVTGTDIAAAHFQQKVGDLRATGHRGLALGR